ncbi:NCS1 family nucleobase:cation symporter-1 [Bacillus sp. EB600]|uniref:NCS1 family nucleobase:cation symporter-1 n=1 Tax=Bacillus sp. EB600 TaxID=2806345 RepID=UPI00210EF887|nr:NCS1 family nucleobase:cation symporter-1 [Bacillus sp. EB600]MCQ6278491.1 NCS1 family nucleobase:cation symporter-1 [Bacillus sp. EB600]
METKGVQNYDSRLMNEDLKPIPKGQRKWTWFSYMALWMGIVHNIFNYSVAASLIVLGMNIWQALLTIFVANIVLMVPLALNGHAGSKFGISFPIYARLSFGVFGANVPALIRAFVAIGWFGIQSYLGAMALNVLMLKVIPFWSDLSTVFFGLPINSWISLIAFWILEAVLAIHGMEVIRRFENWAGPVILVLMLGLVYWAYNILHGVGPILHQPSKFHSVGEFLPVFFPAVITVVGSFATMALNIPDFTRFSRSSKDQVIGQILGLPITTFFFSLMSAFITSATVIAYGKAIWDPVELFKHFDNTIVLVIGAACLAAATISVNVAANLVSPIYDLINAFPKKLNYKRSAIISIVLAFLIMPWKLMQSPDSVHLLLNTAGAFLGPATGIVIADFWIIRKCQVSVDDLYKVEGIYEYKKGFNIYALITMVVGMILSFGGNFIPALKFVSGYGWLIGILVGFFGYYALMKLTGTGPLQIDTAEYEKNEAQKL